MDLMDLMQHALAIPPYSKAHDQTMLDSPKF